MKSSIHILHTLINSQCNDNSLYFCNILFDPNLVHSISQSEEFVFPFEVWSDGY